ncbi:MAG: hypothetical protein GF346_13040, partial [Candidatus Eisenbacteria bacterium]|nr:hypothetical protein [Candidatus Latescibacterota bacterium]MBD3303364.1 hypothetical protein [Candidatus Eisenbacteria bacterium]
MAASRAAPFRLGLHRSPGGGALSDWSHEAWTVSPGLGGGTGGGMERIGPRTGTDPPRWSMARAADTTSKRPSSRRPSPKRIDPAIPVCVIDIGSNSGRGVVFRVGEDGQVEILSDARAPLRLVERLRGKRRLGKRAIDRTLAVLRDFRAIAEGAGAAPTLAVATSAVREAEDAAVLLDRARDEIGVDIEVIDGVREARIAFLGAIHGLPVEAGLLVDVGGGSIQITRFGGRRCLDAWSLPLGALRVTKRFLRSDPPRSQEIQRLRRAVMDALQEAGIPSIGSGEVVVGTGGTIRNLAKIDFRRRTYPIRRLHGYLLTRSRIHEASGQLLGRSLRRRRAIPGLNADRADSIVGGCVAVEALLDHVGARELQVAGRGLREGLLFDALGLEPPPAAVVRTESIAALASRFSTWRKQTAERRVALVRILREALEPDARADLCEFLDHAAAILDVGKSIDYYQRHLHAARILTATDLSGFAHRGIAFLAAVVLFA